ncbi:hypothetical protein ACFL4U_01560, partial [Candidatus Neomarinimicrobiota bacterium]
NHYKVIDFTEFIFLFLGGVASLLTILQALFNLDYYWFFLFALIFGAGVGITKIAKVSMLNRDRMRVYSRNLHSFMHRLRDEHTYLDRFYKHKLGTVEELESRFLDQCKFLINIIADSLTKMSGYTVCVCIKSFRVAEAIEPTSRQEIESLAISTLCRSKNTNEERFEKGSYILKDNTAFRIITLDERNHFYCNDLEGLNADLEKRGQALYQNTNPGWRKWYNATIVVPIRIEKRYLPTHDHDDDSQGYCLLGFLCADSEDSGAFPDLDIVHYTHALKAFSDILFKYFFKYQEIIKLLEA